MSLCSRLVVQTVTFVAVLYGAASLQASSPTAYVSVCCNAPSTAGVFNPSTLARTRSIVTGSGGDSIALSPDGTKMFVTVDARRELQAIATSTGTILARVPVPIGVSGEPPMELAISPDGSRVYVFAPQDVPNSLLLAVDTTTYSVTASRDLPYNQSLGPLLISPDGKQLYFEVGLVNQYIQVIDASTLAPVSQIQVNVSPSALAITPSGLILMTDLNNELMVINPASSAIANRFPLPPENLVMLGAIASSPDSSTAYLTFAGNSILAVNLASGATVFQAPIAYRPTQFAISSDGASLYSIDYSTSNVAWSLSKFNIPAQKPVTTVSQRGPLSGLALSHDGASLYVLNANQSAIVSVDVASQQPSSVSLGGVGIDSLAIPPNAKTVWASSYQPSAGADILVLNRSTGRVSFTAGLKGGLSFSPDGKVLYITNSAKLIALDLASMDPLGSVSAGNLEVIGQAIPSPDGTSLYVSLTFISGVPATWGRPSLFVVGRLATQSNALLPPGVVLVVSTSTYKTVATINIPDGLGALALTPDGSTLVCTSNYGHLHLIDALTNTIASTIQLTPAKGLLSGLAISPDGSTAYATDAANNLLFVASLAAQTSPASYPVGTDPTTVAITPDGSAAWVSTQSGLDIVDLATGQVSGPVRLPGTPSAIAFAP